MVIGATDSGKSTFARYLYSRLRAYHKRVAFIDGDIGQASLGPPTTMTLVVNRDEENFPTPSGICYRVFVGSTSPRGHMLQTVVGLHKLARQAYRLQATATVVDTTGFIDRDQGGGILKFSKVDILEPKVVFAIRRDRELEHVLTPLRRSGRTRLVELSPASAVKPRDFATRRAHRLASFQQYFTDSEMVEINWAKFAVIPSPVFHPGRLISLDNVKGFCIGLGIVTDVNPSEKVVSVITPVRSIDKLDTIRLGNVYLDPDTYEERKRWAIGSENEEPAST
jgi:polynucleotide 5'-hydroxyl-kinase GRC3/NOL9